MLHATSESDITSLTSSPRSSPKPPQQVYYVQSPSRDSHDEDKSSTSAASATATRTTTPSGCRSPSASPSLLSLFGRQSRSSSASRVSGPGHGFRRGKGRREREKRHLLGHVAEGEEEEVRAKDGDIYFKWWKDDDGEELSTCCKVLMSGMVLVLVFIVACLAVWGASRPYNTQVFLTVQF